MKAVCPQCNTSCNVPSRQIPNESFVPTCKSCGAEVVFEARESTRETLLVDYPGLQGLSYEKFDFEEIFSPNEKGTYKSRRNNFKIRIIKAVHTLLEKILKDGEKVMRIGKGTAYHPTEPLFGSGIFAKLYNCYAIVCTNQRILFVNINPRISRPTHFLFHMLYGDIKRVKQGLLHNHLMLYRIDGKSRIFASVKRYLLKELRQFIISKKDSIKSIEVPKESAENLCPSCYVPLQNGLSQCPYCKAHLKEPKKALFRSLVLPGWGDLYLGRKALGILELMGSVIVWVFVTSLLLEGGEGNLVLALFLLLFYNGQDGLFTYQVGKKGYMLAGD